VTKTHEKFVQEVYEFWGNEYTVIGTYSGALQKVKVKHNICDKEWDVIAVSLITGHGCRVCSSITSGKSRRKTHEKFVEDCFSLWGKEYSVIGKYTESKEKVLVLHNLCKNCWDVNPTDFLSGHGCPFCDVKRVSDKNRLSFINPELSKEWHPTKNGKITPYDVSYGSNTDYWWKCYKCGGKWEASPHLRNSGRGCCLNCIRKSINEERIEDFLNKHNIVYISQKSFLDCRSILPLPFDFGIPLENEKWLMIEFQGEQHFFPIDFAGKGKEWAKEEFKKLKIREIIKLSKKTLVI